MVQATNKLLEEVAPWTLLKTDSQKAQEFLSFGLWLLRQLTLAVAPVLIVAHSKMREILGEEAFEGLEDTRKSSKNIANVWARQSFNVDLKPDILYPKI